MRVLDNMVDPTSFDYSSQTKFFRREDVYYLFYTDNSDGVSLYMKQAKSISGLAAATPTRILTNTESILGYYYDVKYNPATDLVGVLWRFLYPATTDLSFVYGSFQSNGNITWSIQHNLNAAPFGLGSFGGISLGYSTSGRWGVSFIWGQDANNVFYTCGRTEPTQTAHWVNRGRFRGGGISTFNPWVVSGLGADSNHNFIIIGQRGVATELQSYSWDGAAFTFANLNAGDPHNPFATPIVDSNGDVHALCREDFGFAGGGTPVWHYIYDTSAGTWSGTEIIAVPNTVTGYAIGVAKDDDNDDMYLVFNYNDGVDSLRFYKYVDGTWHNLTDRLSTLDIANNYTDITSIVVTESGSPTSGGSDTVVAWTDITGAANELWMVEIRDLIADFTASPLRGNVPLRVEFTDTSQSIDTEI